ncbi:uncharacterized protein LOC109087120 isoform X9 [Cyprinus carpio]|uniref:Uncharacterized protein LOC109087120 isoform X9 n=1 Tax=Cyprinus carpio TaxID=7962 RepID=A0A9Q9YLX3_CYPCA|nr:uncharacterized protein LOC109087120 isoform X9 [Cyprinus carpio]
MELFIFIVFQLLMEVQSYNSLPKPFISVSDDYVQLFISCEIPLSVRDDFICSLYTEDDVLLYQRVSHWTQSVGNLCMFYVSRSELLTRSVNSRQLFCVYSLKTEPEIRSSHSDTYTFRDTMTIRDTITIRASTPTTTKHTTTTTAMKTLDVQSKTSLPTSKAKKTQTLNVMSTSETTTYSKPVDVQSKTSLPTSKAKKTQIALNVMSTSETTTYSKTDVLVNKQQKQGNTEENENVYHLYCTIPDKPVHSNTEDHVYSLVKMH